jgi:hypothetical protein
LLTCIHKVLFGKATDEGFKKRIKEMGKPEAKDMQKITQETTQISTIKRCECQQQSKL